MESRVGIFVCECGPNIKNQIDVAALVRHITSLEAVAMVRILPFCCSLEGRSVITEAIRAEHLDRVVIAACSPLEHEHTFNTMMSDAGLNPFLLQIVNLREQCAWVTRDVGQATAKAACLVDAAVARVRLHEPLAAGEIPCRADVLVVGAGIAGISASLALARKDRRVFLVEESPCIGGKAARFQVMFPDLQCGSCLFAATFDAVLHHERIQLLTLTRVESVAGYLGNFRVMLKQEDRGVDPGACVGCGLCQEACPVGMTEASEEGLSRQPAISIPYPGCLPHVAVIDIRRCLRFQGQVCDACQAACPYGAIRFDGGDRRHEISVGAVVLATGCGLFDPRLAPQYGYGGNPCVITAMEMEHLLDLDGPTGGRIHRSDGRPPSRITLVHCVGSRSPAFHEHCSGICCRLSLKYAAKILQDLPETSVAILHSDLCLPGKASQRLLASLARNERAHFLRLWAPDALEVNAHDEGASIRYRDAQGAERILETDLVVLMTALEGGHDGAELARRFDIERDDDGFFLAAHPQTDPLEAGREGILLAGCALAPVDIPTAVAQGQAAAGKILARLIPGETLPLQPVIAAILPERCSCCGLCRAVCSSSAIGASASDAPPVVNAVLCSGCGSCAVTCPSGAICFHHYTDEQVAAEMEGLLGDS